MKIQSLKLNTLIVLGISFFILYPPTFLHYIREKNIMATGSPVYKFDFVKSGHQWIEFPNSTIKDLKITNDRMYCIDTGSLFNNIKANDILRISYTKEFFWGLLGGAKIYSIRKGEIVFYDQECFDEKYKTFSLIALGLILSGIIVSVVKYRKSKRMSSIK